MPYRDRYLLVTTTGETIGTATYAPSTNWQRDDRVPYGRRRLVVVRVDPPLAGEGVKATLVVAETV
jgi:hypothetical protein